MRLLFGLFVSALLVLGITGCKRVAYCENKCYKCMSGSNYHSSADVCVSDLQTKQLYEDYIIMGYDCRKIEPNTFYKLEGKPEDVKQQMAANETEYIHCYDEEEYMPDYFNYEAYVQIMDGCNGCHYEIGEEFVRNYIDSVKVYLDYPMFVEINPGKADTLEMIAQHFAGKLMDRQCGNALAVKVARTGYSDYILRDLEYDQSLPPDEHDEWVATNSWLDFIPAITYPMNPAIYPKCP